MAATTPNTEMGVDETLSRMSKEELIQVAKQYEIYVSFTLV